MGLPLFSDKLGKVMILAIIEESTTGELSKEPCVSHHITQSIQTGQNIFKCISYTVIQLAKFNTPQDKIQTEREKWLWFMTKAPTTAKNDYHNFIGNDTILQNAYKMLLTTSYTPKELYEMGKADKEFEEHVAKIHEEHEKGLQEGIEIGVEKGMKEGLREGERNAKIETALNALKLGLSVDVAAKISGLTEDEVLNLKKRYKPDYGACLSLVCLYRYYLCINITGRDNKIIIQILINLSVL